MSLDIKWSSLSPSIGETIKTFLNNRLDGVELPSILRSIEVLAFELGSIPPEITIKDIADPFPEFYAEDTNQDINASDDESEPEEQEQGTAGATRTPSSGSATTSPQQRRRSLSQTIRSPAHERNITTDDLETASTSSGPPPYDAHLIHRPSLSVNGWEGMNLPYFQSAFATPSHGIVSASGLSTPRPRFMGGSNTFQPVESSIGELQNVRTETGLGGQRNVSSSNAANISGRKHWRISSAETTASREPKVSDDIQLEVHLQYSGNIVVQLKADLALNYPSPSFVTLPIEMTISELQIDTVAVLAYIESQLHVSLLEGPENPIRDLKIESRIGEQAKVSLNDVEKVEKFMLREVQDMLERELVFPSYYTFLV